MFNMSTRAGYSPVIDVVKQPSKKKLAQGSLTSVSSDMVFFQNNEAAEVSKKVGITAMHRMQPKVICHSPAVVHNQIDKCALTEKIVVDSPPTAFVTGGASSASLNMDTSVSRNNANKLSLARPATSVKEGDVDEASYDLHSCGTATSNNTPVPTEAMNTIIAKEMPKKKRLTKTVPSRYKQQFDRTKIEHVSAKPSSSKLIKTKVNKPIKPTFHRSDNKSLTVDNKSLKGKTSTPSSQFKTFFESDMSAIQPAPIDKKVKMASSGKQDSVSSTSVYVAYAQYLCGAYMKAATQKSSQMRQMHALNDLTKLCNANIKLHHEVADLENEVKSLKFERDLEIQVNDQIENLGPIMNKLSNVSDNYKEMAENVDTTRHGLPITEVKLPLLNDLEMSLNKTQSLLNDMKLLNQSYSHSCSEAAENAKCINQTVTDEINHCEEVETSIANLSHLCIKDTNLKLQLHTEASETS